MRTTIVLIAISTVLGVTRVFLPVDLTPGLTFFNCFKDFSHIWVGLLLGVYLKDRTNEKEIGITALAISLLELSVGLIQKFLG